MPFLPLPPNPALLRFTPHDITFHYLISTPSHPTFRYAATHPAELASSLLPDSPPAAAAAAAAAGGGGAVGGGAQLDPRYPIILFLPSECFSVAHLFSSQLADPVLSSRFNLVAVDPRGHGLTRDVPIQQGVGRKYDLDIKAGDCLDFVSLLLGGRQRWGAGMHILACSMSGLVAARMAACWPAGSFDSIMITSPIVERESEFMVESFQGIKELLEESWRRVHERTARPRLERRMSDDSSQPKLPVEVVQGFTYRWAGSEQIPDHIASYLSKTWLERLVLHPKGMEAARDWWFDLYWLRSPMAREELEKITCDILVVEGDTDLPYDRKVGDEVAGLFGNARSTKVVSVEDAPFLLSVKRAEQLTKEICEFLQVDAEEGAATPEIQGLGERIVAELEEEERLELVKVYGANLVLDSSSDDEDDDSEVESDTSPTQYRFRLPSTGDVMSTTRGKRAGSASSASNNYFSTSMYSTAGEGEEGGGGGGETGPLIRTMHETHL